MLILLSKAMYLYAFQEPLKRLCIFETFENASGACAFYSGPSFYLIAVPSRFMGQIQILKSFYSQGSSHQGTILMAHHSAIACLQFSPSGRLLASASQKGTLIRIWDLEHSQCIGEYRRGSDSALIYSIAFSSNESKIAVSSDKGTIHVFHIQNSQEPPTEPIEHAVPTLGNRHSILSSFSSYLPKYFSSEWSFASYSLPQEIQCMVRFTESDMAFRHKHDPLLGPGLVNDESGLLVLCADGSLYKLRMDPKKGGPCVLESFYVCWKKARVSSGDEFWSTDSDWDVTA